MTKERPILFSAPMVRALLDDSKTQTRRPYKARKHPDFGCEMAAFELAGSPQHVIDRLCPYGQPGDRLWVRETHRPIFGQTCGLIGVDYQADPREKWERLGDAPECLIKMKWTPSIHMRREYSRILLEVVSVRVERLQDCSKKDAIAEGIHRYEHFWRDAQYPLDDVAYEPVTGWPTRYSCPVQAYQVLWEGINGAGSWALNPWVWVVEFKRIKEFS